MLPIYHHLPSWMNSLPCRSSSSWKQARSSLWCRRRRCRGSPWWTRRTSAPVISQRGNPLCPCGEVDFMALVKKTWLESRKFFVSFSNIHSCVTKSDFGPDLTSIYIVESTHNNVKPCISGVNNPRRVQKCKGLIFYFWKLARNLL